MAASHIIQLGLLAMSQIIIPSAMSHNRIWWLLIGLVFQQSHHFSSGCHIVPAVASHIITPVTASQVVTPGVASHIVQVGLSVFVLNLIDQYA